MQDVKVESSDNLITSNICPKVESYHLVTEAQLSSTTGKSIFANIFVFIASIFWGAFTSIFISKATALDVPESTMKALEICQRISFSAAILFTLLAAFFLLATYLGINEITKSSLSQDQTT